MNLNQVVVKGVINTTAKNGAGDVINIDGTGNLQFLKIKRYTLSIFFDQLFAVTAGKDKIVVNVGILDGTTAYDVAVGSYDPAKVSGQGIVLPPYVGTNSYITVVRKADGKGAVPIRFNAIVEVEP